ncbi:nucleotide exchange factor GrpE [Leptolyngbya sp. AN02str]|uniref:nucleotide exchange factor GrpE n=1 Tax=Leptolyngbya sp. AN02str TaxID=3423363 RepID=UPI003D3130BD
MTQPNYAGRLRSLMEQAGISSRRSLAQVAQVSEWQVRQLAQGKAATMRVESLHRISQALRVAVATLIQQFAELEETTVSSNTQSTDSHITALQQEYQRLQTQLAEQRLTNQQEFQQAALQILEPLMTYLPTALYRAQQDPNLAATKLVPLLRPIDQLLASWGIEAIAPVGEELPYNPQQHELLRGSANPGDRVRVSNAGYQQGEKLLYRAKVSPMS